MPDKLQRESGFKSSKGGIGLLGLRWTEADVKLAIITVLGTALGTIFAVVFLGLSISLTRKIGAAQSGGAALLFGYLGIGFGACALIMIYGALKETKTRFGRILLGGCGIAILSFSLLVVVTSVGIAAGIK